MDLDILKESIIEYCENIFALGIGYIRKNADKEVNRLLKKIELLEDEIRYCDNIESLNSLKKIIENIGNELEAKFNE